MGKNSCRTPQGVRGLKLESNIPNRQKVGRTPQGVRGLKLQIIAILPTLITSHPARGAWIEIHQ